MSKIVLFGNGKSVIEAHKYLENQKHKVLSVIDPDDKGEDSWKLSFKKYCADNHKDFLSPSSFKNKNFIKSLKEFKPNFMLSLQCSQIIKKEIIKIVKGEIFNFHFADLPRIRGCYPAYWHVRNGDNYAGVTLHKLIEAPDAGNIIAKRRKKIKTEDTTKSIYGWCQDNAIVLLKQNLNKLLTKTYSENPQDISLVNYYSRYSVDFAFPFIDWSQKTPVVSRSIQALIFPPLQYPKTRYKGKEVKIQKILKIGNIRRKTIPGTVLRINKNKPFYEVQTKDGSIWIEIRNTLPLKKGELLYL